MRLLQIPYPEINRSTHKSDRQVLGSFRVFSREFAVTMVMKESRARSQRHIQSRAWALEMMSACSLVTESAYPEINSRLLISGLDIWDLSGMRMPHHGRRPAEIVPQRCLAL
jgi:hypothetical protein